MVGVITDDGMLEMAGGHAAQAAAFDGVDAGVVADEKMSEIAGVELTHLMARASFKKSSWRCPTDSAEGGTSERNLRDERGRPFHAGDLRGSGHRPEHGTPESEITRFHEAEASLSEGIEAVAPHGIRRPAGAGGGWKTAWSCTGSSGPSAMSAATPS